MRYFLRFYFTFKDGIFEKKAFQGNLQEEPFWNLANSKSWKGAFAVNEHRLGIGQPC